MADIHEPSKLESAGDKMNDNANRDDSQAHKDLAAGVSAGNVAEANEKNLSLGMERRLQAMALMEQLAANYRVYGKNLKSGGGYDDERGVTPPSADVTMPPPIAMPSASAGGPGAASAGNKPWSAGSTSSIKPAPAVPRDVGITGSSQLPTAKTKVDSISPGLTGTGPNTGSVGVSGGGGGLGTGGAQSSGVVGGGMQGLGAALPHGAGSEPQAVVVVWPVAVRQQDVVPEAELAWAAWVAPEQVRSVGGCWCWRSWSPREVPWRRGRCGQGGHWQGRRWGPARQPRGNTARRRGGRGWRHGGPQRPTGRGREQPGRPS